MANKKQLLVITPIEHIPGIYSKLSDNFTINYKPLPLSIDDFQPDPATEFVFTNPNKSSIYIGKEFLEKFPNIKAVCTASTGTVHVDKSYCADHGIKLLSLTEERETISQITSTAEHAFLLLMSGLRHFVPSVNSVSEGLWDYQPFVGRQMTQLKIGVIGYGRLGSLFAHYCDSFGADVFVFDPYKSVVFPRIRQIASLPDLIRQVDAFSLHVHVTSETLEFINKDLLSLAKNPVTIVNTSRGEIINEHDLLNFLESSRDSIYCADVYSHEFNGLRRSALWNSNLFNDGRIQLTPHIGGMTIDAQILAYGRACDMLISLSSSFMQ